MTNSRSDHSVQRAVAMPPSGTRRRRVWQKLRRVLTAWGGLPLVLVLLTVVQLLLVTLFPEDDARRRKRMIGAFEAKVADYQIKEGRQGVRGRMFEQLVLEIAEDSLRTPPAKVNFTESEILKHLGPPDYQAWPGTAAKGFVYGYDAFGKRDWFALIAFTPQGTVRLVGINHSSQLPASSPSPVSRPSAEPSSGEVEQRTGTSTDSVATPKTNEVSGLIMPSPVQPTKPK